MRSFDLRICRPTLDDGNVDDVDGDFDIGDTPDVMVIRSSR